MKRSLIISSLLCLVPALARAQDAGIAPAAASAQLSAADAAPAKPDEAAPSAASNEASSYLPAASSEAAEVPLTAAELESLGLNTNQAGTDTSIEVSGFADFSVSTALVPETAGWRVSGSAPPRTSFYVGNFNLYIKKNLTETLRTMGEVRFSYLPNGAYDLSTGTRTTTATPDYSDYGRTMRWGAIEIERLYLEWSAHPLIAVRVGQFLTPYGIWNVDHGSPTYIPTQRPFVIGNSWFPERQTGFELFGRWDAFSNSTFGYHLTLSNGGGPISEYQDLDENKAIGARLYWEYHALGELRVGGSAYYGRDTGATWAFRVTPDGRFLAAEKIDTQFDALAWAADISWKYRGWHLQSEWITYQRAYTRKGRAALPAFPGAPVNYAADHFTWGMYALAGYRFAWLGVMPFAVIEHIDGGVQALMIKNVTYQIGLNVRPVDVLTLKLVYYHVQFFVGPGKGDPLRMLHAQVAWAF